MFYRGVSEEAVTTASSNIETSIHLNTNPTTTTNMNDDEKHLALNEFSNNNSMLQSNGKDLIKQEPNDKHLYKFDYSNSQGNIGGGGGGSTNTSTTNSASTSPSASSSASSTTNRKYSFQEHAQPPSAKRKTFDHHHHHHHNHHSHHHHHKTNNLHSSSSSSQHQVYHKKPVYSEFVSSKCILFIYYKGDLSFVIDDHFKKSITLNAAKASSASISPLSLSSSSSSASTSPSSKSSLKSSLHKTSNCFNIFLF
jgi:hypothetical protein